MSKAEVPCVLDPMRNCPETCRLRDNAKNAVDTVTSHHDRTREQTVRILRFGDSDLLLLTRFVNSRKLRDRGKSKKCVYYPSADVRFKKRE